VTVVNFLVDRDVGVVNVELLECLRRRRGAPGQLRAPPRQGRERSGRREVTARSTESEPGSATVVIYDCGLVARCPAHQLRLVSNVDSEMRRAAIGGRHATTSARRQVKCHPACAVPARRSDTSHGDSLTLSVRVTILHLYSAPIRERTIAMSVSVCLCVCPRSYLRNYTSDLHQIFAHVTYGRGSVLLWRRSDTLCTSGFMDDVIILLISQGCSTSPPS